MEYEKPVYIKSLEAKDLYLYNQGSVEGNGSRTGYETNGTNYRKYINTLDYSLDLIKLREIDRAVFRNNRFSFCNDDGKEFSDRVVNVKFTYNIKQYNQFAAISLLNSAICRRI